MLTLQLLALSLAMLPSLASAALFPPDSMVKLLDAKGFKKVMKANQTSIVAFVAPWCGHCQKMVPEYSKAAQSLHPLIPAYAVDCDDNKNKRLCADQHVQGFPTVKVYPRGNQVPAMSYEGERTASAFFKYVSLRVPNHVAKLKPEEINSWIEKDTDKPRALLLTKEKKVPLLWKVLGNKYKGELQLGTVKDEKGKALREIGLKKSKSKESKVVIYPARSTKPVLYEGATKLESLSKYFDSVLDGTADFPVAEEPATDDTESKASEETTASPTDDEQVVLEAKEAAADESTNRPNDEL
ncbi:hypothetical protein AX17_001980 [Amanita inopinata Kibby_2008]|nr:hypothetical protein AX17_001980 [Amanita inopinata Kibby_2008]